MFFQQSGLFPNVPKLLASFATALFLLVASASAFALEPDPRRAAPIVADSLDVNSHVARLLIPAFGLALQRSQNDFIQPHVDVHFVRRRLEAADGQFAGEHLVKHDLQGFVNGTHPATADEFDDL